jgi:hypothetical protein
VPATETAGSPELTVNVAEPSEVGAIASLKTALTLVLIATPTASPAGLLDSTLGTLVEISLSSTRPPSLAPASSLSPADGPHPAPTAKKSAIAIVFNVLSLKLVILIVSSVHRDRFRRGGRLARFVQGTHRRCRAATENRRSFCEKLRVGAKR